jgi:uncharacterized protein with ParB-like and HNH nuclease domain
MDSQTKTLEQIIFGASTKQLRIPKFQRPYSWERQQIEDFWDDLIQLNPTYFIGPIIVNTENSNSQTDSYIEIVDGQQRLISSTILSAVLRDTFKEFGEIEKSNKIQDRFIAFVDDDGNDRGYRLTTGLSTKDFFEENIQKKDADISSSAPDTKEHNRIKSNYEILKKKLYDYISPEPNASKKMEKISSLRDTLKKLKVIEIKIESDEEAYEIFERVNNYGVDLSLSDLLKNHILKNTSNISSSSEKWLAIENNIQDSGSEMKKFIRYHWLSKYSFETEKKLYNTIKASVNNYEKFLDELVTSSEVYKNILTGISSNFSDLIVNGKDISSKIHNIVFSSMNMSITQDTVFYLSLIRNIEAGKLLVKPDNFLIKLENFLFKYFAVSSLPANKVERLFSKYATQLEEVCNENIPINQIKQNTTRVYNNFKDDLNDLLPPKEYFIEKFKDVKYAASPKNRRLITYILSNYESHLRGNRELSLNYRVLNIEHLLPQKPESWGITRSDTKGYVNNIGNLLLIDQSLNSRMGNKPLSDKIPILGESSLKMNEKILDLFNINNNIWNQDEIEKRNSILAEIAYSEIWS